MKPIPFESSAAQKVYSDYINRIKRVVKSLPKEDRNDVLMEFNSHIFESVQQRSSAMGPEIDTLLEVLETLGAPEEVLQPRVADMKLKQATRSFNPLHVFKALALNIGNGIFYTLIAILYLFLFVFVFIIGAEMLYPEEVGLYFKNGHFQLLGLIDEKSRNAPEITEVLGNWFIPVMILVAVLWYVLITILLRIKRKK